MSSMVKSKQIESSLVETLKETEDLDDEELEQLVEDVEALCSTIEGNETEMLAIIVMAMESHGYRFGDLETRINRIDTLRAYDPGNGNVEDFTQEDEE